MRTMGNFELIDCNGNVHFPESTDEKYDTIKRVLKREDLDYWDVHDLIAHEWAAFYEDPEKYADTIVPSLVNEYLNSYTDNEDTSIYASQSVMLDDLRA